MLPDLVAQARLADSLREVIDPELGVDIVSLGLLYGLELTDRTAQVVMTTTTPACPLGGYLSDEIERVLLGSGAVDRVEIDLTHEPAWSADMMSGGVKQAFGW